MLLFEQKNPTKKLLLSGRTYNRELLVNVEQTAHTVVRPAARSTRQTTSVKSIPYERFF
jgi:hypothetical protein